MSMNTTKQQEKQKVDIIISFSHDQDCLYWLYQEYLSYRQKYIDRGFSEQQAKYYNRIWEQDINAIKNDDWISLYVNISANIKMPCGHIEEFKTHLGGYILDYRNMDLNKEFPNEANDLIEELKDQIKAKMDINNIEFNTIVNTDIKYD